jgi:hypothetical protein
MIIVFLSLQRVCADLIANVEKIKINRPARTRRRIVHFFRSAKPGSAIEQFRQDKCLPRLRNGSARVKDRARTAATSLNWHDPPNPSRLYAKEKGLRLKASLELRPDQA